MYDKLNWLTSVPRNLTPEMEAAFETIYPKPFFFAFWTGGIKGWKQRMSNATLSWAYVVQANSCLYDPNEAQWAPAVLLASDAPEASNPAWVEQHANHIIPQLREGATHATNQYRVWLEHEESSFHSDIPTEITGGPRFRIWTTHIDPAKLPGKHIPQNQMIPTLHHDTNEWALIPPTFYR